MSAGATFVAQSFSSNLKQLTALIEAGLKHKGFSLINVFSPCVTFNKVNTYDWFKENIVNLDAIPGLRFIRTDYGHDENHGNKRHADRNYLPKQRAQIVRGSGYRLSKKAVWLIKSLNYRKSILTNWLLNSDN